MAVLAIDSCLAACSASLLREDGEAVTASEVIGTGHAERIAPMVAGLLARAGTTAAALTRIACTVGPGSFMGARVGVSLAKGLALPRAVPCVPFTTLEAIALRSDDPCTVLIDARRGQAYAQDFRADGGGPTILSHEEARALADGPVLGVGLGAILGGEHPGAYPDTGAMTRAALARTAAALRPFYLRAPDAKPPSRPPL
jgi:tRNA threonylcarbamoyladenosine biosynthesis protein TsaB